MHSLTVTAPALHSSYPVVVGRGLLSQLAALINAPSFSSMLVVADAGLPSSVVSCVITALGLPQSKVLRLEGGEQIKSIAGLEKSWSFFAEQRLDRSSAVVNLGGGALSDLAGFAASTFMRGVPFFNVPTTLLAQVDASVGGKTGINFADIKNLVGSINQPAGVVIDIDCLSTLPLREKLSGFAEIVKHGLIADISYFELVTAQSYNSWSADELVDIVHRSCGIKKKVIELDPREQGPRKTLNFGHTIGHAVESFMRQTPAPLTHGEAIAIGMSGEATLSCLSQMISSTTRDAVIAGIARTGLPTKLPHAVEIQTLRDILGRDKKNSGDTVKWSLLTQIGEAGFDAIVPDELIVQALLSIQPSSTLS